MRLVQASGKATEEEWILPEQIVEKKGGHITRGHMFVDAFGRFATPLNTWEIEFPDWAAKQDGFHCWLRNFPRRDWAISIPYELAGQKPFFPDFVVIRKRGSDYLVDLLEPHDDARVDTWAKVKGMAQFADSHHLQFGRLLVGRKKDGTLQVVDVSDAKTRERARAMGAPADLEALFQKA